MQLTINMQVLPSDWSNLFSTFIDSGYSRYWCDFAAVQTARLIRGGQAGIASDYKWEAANYGRDETYAADRAWRAIIKPHVASMGATEFDGKTWGWRGKGGKIKRKYVLYANDFEKAATLDPKLFQEWLESGERNTSASFDGPASDTLMQLVTFGVCVFG